MFCCGLNRRKRNQHRVSGSAWKFSNGTTVMASTFDDAVRELEDVVAAGRKEFWASETTTGKWDVQISDTVIVYDISAESVMQAVRIARWKAYLDKGFKRIDTLREYNVFEPGKTHT